MNYFKYYAPITSVDVELSFSLKFFGFSMQLKPIFNYNVRSDEV